MESGEKAAKISIGLEEEDISPAQNIKTHLLHYTGYKLFFILHHSVAQWTCHPLRPVNGLNLRFKVWNSDPKVVDSFVLGFLCSHASPEEKSD